MIIVLKLFENMKNVNKEKIINQLDLNSVNICIFSLSVCLMNHMGLTKLYQPKE